MRKNQNDAFIYDPENPVYPVAFGRGESNRRFLKKERFYEEIIEFIKEMDLEIQMFTAIINNNVGFSYDIIGETVFLDGTRVTFGVPGQEKVTLECFPENVDAWNKHDPKYRPGFVVVDRNGTAEGMQMEVVYVPVTEDSSEADHIIFDNLMFCFLKFAKIDTYHKLGKAINVGAQGYLRWELALQDEIPACFNNETTLKS